MASAVIHHAYNKQAKSRSKHSGGYNAPNSPRGFGWAPDSPRGLRAARDGNRTNIRGILDEQSSKEDAASNPSRNRGDFDSKVDETEEKVDNAPSTLDYSNATETSAGKPGKRHKRSPRRNQLKAHDKFARNTSVLKQYKTQEDVICNQVLWMALITHLGKTERTGTLKAEKFFVIAPQSTFRTYWDSISMIFIIYIIAFTPMQVAFMAPPMMKTSLADAPEWPSMYGCEQGEVPCFNYWGIFVMDLIIDLFFTADIVVNFRSAWVDSDPYSPTFKQVQYSCSQASKSYILGMFIIDVISVFPFWLLDIMPGIAAQGSLLRVPRLLRLAKLIKLFRVLRASRVFRRWNKAITTTCSSSVAMLMELTTVLIVSVHLMGCAWFLIASLHIGFEQPYENKYGAVTTSTTTPNTTTPVPYEETPEWWDGNSWILRVYSYQANSISELYLASIYFALATITTIGYGDIVPVIFVERVTAFICMVIGVIVFAYVVGQVTVLIATCTERKNMFFDDMSTLQKYLKTYPFSNATKTRAIDFFYYTYNNGQYKYDSRSRRETLTQFSPYLQRNLAYAELKHFLVGWKSLSEEEIEEHSDITYPDPLPFLTRASQHIIKDLCVKLESHVYGPIEIVAYQGGPCNKMFTLDQGCMCCWGNKYSKGLVELAGWKYVQKAARFGTDSLLLHLDKQQIQSKETHIATWPKSYQTLTFCDFITLEAEMFAEVMKRYPKMVRTMRPFILRAKFRRFCNCLLHMPPQLLQAIMDELPRTRGAKISGVKEDVAKALKKISSLRHENAKLKAMVQDVQSELLDQRSQFDERIDQVLHEQRQLLTTQHQELLSLLRSQPTASAPPAIESAPAPPVAETAPAPAGAETAPAPAAAETAPAPAAAETAPAPAADGDSEASAS